MKGVKIDGDSIQFTLTVPNDSYFTKPVPLRYRNSSDVPPEQFEFRSARGALDEDGPGVGEEL